MDEVNDIMEKIDTIGKENNFSPIAVYLIRSFEDQKIHINDTMRYDTLHSEMIYNLAIFPDMITHLQWYEKYGRFEPLQFDCNIFLLDLPANTQGNGWIYFQNHVCWWCSQQD